jgi:hypothetical protein
LKELSLAFPHLHSGCTVIPIVDLLDNFVAGSSTMAHLIFDSLVMLSLLSSFLGFANK